MTRHSPAIAAVALLAVAVLAAAAAQESPATAPTTEVAGIPITLSRATTYFTGPLREDGTVDYLAAINAMQSEGVTPENNAAVLLLRAFGPDLLPPETRTQVLEALGLTDVPPLANRFITLEAFARENAARYGLDVPAPSKQSDPGGEPSTSALADAIRERLQGAAEAPWAAEEDRLIADWLEANEQPLGVIHLAVQRPRYWMPRYADGPAVVAMQLPAQSLYREAARALVARAMLRVAQRQPQAAWEDLLATHLLARHVGASPTLVERLAAAAIERFAAQADARLANSGALSAAQARSAAQALAALPPLPPMAGAIDLAERAMALDAAMQALQAGRGANDRGFAAEVDWNDVLRRLNDHYDRIAAAMHETDPHRRSKLFAALNRQIEAMERRLQPADGGPFASDTAAVAGMNPQRRTEAVLDLLLAVLLPATERVNAAYFAATAETALAQTAYALAAYHAEHGGYPADLQSLSPAYLPQVPIDPFSGEPLRYQLSNEGYILHSVGPDDATGPGADAAPPGLTVRGRR